MKEADLTTRLGDGATHDENIERGRDQKELVRDLCDV